MTLRRRFISCRAELLAGLLALLPLAAAAQDNTGLSLSGGWIRMVLPQHPAAGYFTLTNKTAKPRILTGANSPGCGSIMLHKSVMHNGMAEMTMEKSVEVPAHGVLVFAPSGYHLMCMQPSVDLKIGGRVPVTFTFADGSTLTDDFEVRGATGQ